MLYQYVLTIVCKTLVVILEPPEAPTTRSGMPNSDSTIVGAVDDRGLFPGSGKLYMEGANSKLLDLLN